MSPLPHLGDTGGVGVGNIEDIYHSHMAAGQAVSCVHTLIWGGETGRVHNTHPSCRSHTAHTRIALDGGVSPSARRRITLEKNYNNVFLYFSLFLKVHNRANVPTRGYKEMSSIFADQ